MFKHLTILALAGAVAVAADARANLVGDTVDAQYLYPTFGTVQQDGGTQVVGGAHPLYPSFATDNPGESVDVTGSQIIFQFLGASTHSASPFNGILVADLTNPFVSVALDGATNLAGFTSSDVAISAAGVSVNWAGLAYDPSEQVVLDVATAAPLPEAASVALLALPLTGLGLIRRGTRRAG